MTSSFALSMQEAAQVVDAYRFLPSPPQVDRRQRQTVNPGTAASAGDPDVDADVDAIRDADSAPRPFTLFEDSPTALAAVAVPKPSVAAVTVQSAARAFVEGKLEGRVPAFDAVQTTALKAASFVDLSFAKCPWFGRPAYHARVALLVEGLANVRELGLRGLELSPERLTALMPPRWTQLTSLQLSANALGEGAATLFADVWPNLRFLAMSRSGLRDDLLRSLPGDHLPSLVDLQLDDNLFTGEAIEDGRLHELPALRQLSLANCGLTFAGGALMRGVAKLHLDALNLRDNPVVSDARLPYVTALVQRVVTWA